MLQWKKESNLVCSVFLFLVEMCSVNYTISSNLFSIKLDIRLKTQLIWRTYFTFRSFTNKGSIEASIEYRPAQHINWQDEDNLIRR